jgi:dTDP-4-amino-4,6-dideoxygalactose transaminase
VSVPFLDLRRQHRALEAELTAAFREVLDGSQFILGPHVKALEAELAAYCGAEHGIGVGSGTDALRLALEACGVGRDTEVITTPFTFVATAEMVSQLGATPVFADIDPTTLTLDPRHVAKKITARTRAILPVHLYGLAADMDPIMKLAEEHGLMVIEDAAQAVGGTYQGRRLGSIGHLACFSFFPTKNLGACGDGGFVTTGDAKLADHVRVLRQHGSRKKYVHEYLGLCSRLDELQAALVRVKFRHLDAWTEQRRAHARRYVELLQGLPIELPAERPGDRAVYHLFTIRTPARNALQDYLQRRGIGTMVHYPIPLHQQPIYRDLTAETFPESERAGREVLSLPLYAEITAEEIETVARTIREFFATAA